jgi:hypothetical protein
MKGRDPMDQLESTVYPEIDKVMSFYGFEIDNLAMLLIIFWIVETIALASLRRPPMPGLPTGTVTFLFTDIEGSTRLLQSLDGRYAEVLQQQRRMRTAFTEGNGGEVVTQKHAFPQAYDPVN